MARRFSKTFSQLKQKFYHAGANKYYVQAHANSTEIDEQNDKKPDQALSDDTRPLDEKPKVNVGFFSNSYSLILDSRRER